MSEAFLRWRRFAGQFLAQEIWAIGGGVFWGLSFSAVAHFCLYEGTSRAFLNGQFSAGLKEIGNPKFYLPYAIMSATVLTFLGAARAWPLLCRGIRSWNSGVTSGLGLVSFASTFIISAAIQLSWMTRLIANVVIIVAATVYAYFAHLRAVDRKVRLPAEEDVCVALGVKNGAGAKTLESDDPIQSWEEDTLGRAALVDSITVKVLIARAPVIALFGEFGSGKTSILNLLRSHLADKAIVISFSTWLPGSQETLTSYLMADIVSEAQKHYVVPGLRKSTRKFVSALSESLPFLKGLPQLLPATTQKDDIDSLRQALQRLPQRIVVLLDELDRMEKAELTTLLKVVRGISSLPNLSFVCAAERVTLVKTICPENDFASSIYFEKFFPVAISVPRLDDSELSHAGVERLIKSLNMRMWFESLEEEQDFRKQLGHVWPSRISPFCGTLRAIGLLANDVGMAAAPLRREVDPIDLVLIELLRRWQYDVYNLIASNRIALTGGLNWSRGGAYYSGREQELELEQFGTTLKTIIKDQAELSRVQGVIGELFPDFAKSEKLALSERPRRETYADKDIRISDPEIFPAYFRYELPKAIFSTTELEILIRDCRRAGTLQERKTFLEQKLKSMERGSLKKDDFFRRLSESSKTVDIDIGRGWVSSILALANDLTYDSFSAFGEAGHVIRMIMRLSERLEISARIQFLSECILDATDDTIPVRVLTHLTNPQAESYQDVSFAELYPSFIQRMRRRYGRDVDAGNVDLTTSDKNSFNLWGFDELSKHNVVFDPEDRAIQYEFWERFIGNSRSRLIRTFNDYLMPLGVYDENPRPFVERKFSFDVLQGLYRRLPDDTGMKGIPTKDVRRIERFLDGSYENGIGIHLAKGEPDVVDDEHESSGEPEEHKFEQT